MTQPWEEILSIPILLQLYSGAMEKYGGLPSPPNPGCLEQCLGNAWTAEQYLQDEDKGIQLGLIFASRLFWYLSKDHCFSDGNKRIGWYCLTFVLAHYNLSLEATDDEAVEFATGVVEGKISPEEVAIWIAARLIEA